MAIQSNDELKKVHHKKKLYNEQFSQFYKEMFVKYQDRRYFKRSKRMQQCLDLFIYDKYEQNKILDLQKVNRCNITRFCPNCKLLSQRKYYFATKPEFDRLTDEGYNLYFLTLTRKNIKAEDLGDTIDFMNKNFKKLFNKFNQPIGTGFNGLKDRLIKIEGALKTLEITYNQVTDEYHPHFHVLLILEKDLNYKYLKKYIKGRYSYKTNSVNYHSDFEMQLMKVWSLLDSNKRINKTNLNNLPNAPSEDPNALLRVIDLREFDSKGYLELLKYTVKDTDALIPKVFETLVKTLENKRIRQTYGKLFNFADSDELDCGEYEELILQIEEDPEPLKIRDIENLYTTYSEYKKISRFTPKNINLQN